MRSPFSLEDRPRIRVLSFSAGPCSSTLLLLACEERIRRFDAVVFADPGWQHPAVYHRIARLTSLAADAGMPVYRVSGGNVRADALSRIHQPDLLPLWQLPPGDGSTGPSRCADRYKAQPVKAKVRELIGLPPTARIMRGAFAELAIGLAAEEIGRMTAPDVRYLRYAYPLAELGWTTRDCIRYLAERGVPCWPRPGCLGCPHNGDRWWRHLRDRDPLLWADVVAFDRAIRHSGPDGPLADYPGAERYVHRSRRPLGQAFLGPVRTLNGVAGYAEHGLNGCCAPWTRPTGGHAR